MKKGLKKEELYMDFRTSYYIYRWYKINKNEILDKKIKVIKTNRGGKITFHNPGQKIIYFVINLNKRKKDIRFFIKQ